METIWNLLFKSLVSSSAASSNDMVPPQWKRTKFVASSSREPPRQAVLPRLTQINDSVFEVFSPQERHPSVEIMFFHGLQLEGSSSAHVHTWLSRDHSEFWLYWILENIPNARILITSYDAHARRTSAEGVMDMYGLTENLLSDLVDAEVGQDGCPVVLVGHCVGGLVIKELCVHANYTLGLHETHVSDGSSIGLQNFLLHLKGLFFFASPHQGTRLADKSTSSSKGLLFEDVKTNHNQGARRNEDFRKLRKKYGWRTFGLAEGRESHLVTPYLGAFTGFIVAESSARNDVDTFYTDTTADHFQVCQPHSRQSSNFRRLSDFVSQVVKADNKTRQGHKIGFPDEVIGLQDQVNLVLKKLKQTPRLGIVGMGGIGKTTLAKTVYNIISHKFEYTCFLPEVKKLFSDEENPGTLRATIVKDLYWKGRKVREDFEWSTLKGKSVLIGLDDAKTGSQVRVMTKFDGFLEESRVIVTSRDRGFLMAENFRCHFAERLEYQDSRKLFCLHAFRTSNAPIGSEDQLARMVNKCAGLPLALKVAGRYLCTRPKRLWDDAFEKLSRAEPLAGATEDGLWSILTISYDSLAQAERELFLDVATFFHGQSLNTAKKVWALCGWKGVECSWENLLDKGLVMQFPVRDRVEDYVGPNDPRPLPDYIKNMGKLDEFSWDDHVVDYIIDMHEVLRDLGRSKACPHRRYDLDLSWVSYNVFNPAACSLWNQGQPRVEILNISNPPRDTNSPIIHISTLHVLHDLRILSLDGGIYEGAFHLFPRRLTYLKVRDLYEWIDSLNETSAQKSEADQTLQYLEIEWCSSLRSLPNSLEQLHDLQHLSIYSCDELQVLPSLRRLQALEHLAIEYCPNLEVFPECLGELQILKYLSIRHCYRLRSLGGSFGELRALQHLEIKNCGSLVLPHTLGQVKDLKHLEIKRCRSLGTLGDDIEQLKALRHLDVESCDDSDVPLNNLGQLQALEYLRISECLEKEQFWAALPDGLGELQCLKQLRLLGTTGFKALPNTIGDLRALEVLRLDECLSLESLPETLGQLQALKTLTIDSNALETLPETLGQLQALETLAIDSRALKTLPDSLGQLQALQYLHIRAPLDALPGSVGSLQALEYLHVEPTGEGIMETLPDGVGELPALKQLNLHFLFDVKSLPHSLEHLSFFCCGEYLVPDNLGELRELEELEITWCSGFRFLPDTVAQLRALKRLTLDGCDDLEAIPDSLGQLESLEHLEIWDCPNLKHLPDSLKRRGFTLAPQKHRQESFCVD